MTARPARPSGRSGPVVGALVNVVLLWMVNVQPGWDAVPFLTDETPRVLPWVNLSLAAGLVTNLVYLVSSGPRVRALGELTTSSIGLVAAVRILQVFPFDLDQPYSTVVQVLLVLAVVGSAIAIVVNLVSMVRVQRTGRPAAAG
jgi:hypothetical protein